MALTCTLVLFRQINSTNSSLHRLSPRVFGLLKVEIWSYVVQNPDWQCRRLVIQDRKLFMRGRKGVLHDWISFVTGKVRTLAEPLSISFLRLSTSTSIKKTEMNQNVTFPDVNAMNDAGKCDDNFPLATQKTAIRACA